MLRYDIGVMVYVSVVAYVFMLWYCDTALVLRYVIGVMVYVNIVAYAMYVMVL